MPLFSEVKAAGITIRESANDGSDFTNPDADYRRLFLGEDGLLHLKDSSGTVTDISAGSVDAADVTFDPTGLDNTAATDVQAALEDYDAAITAASSGGLVGPAPRALPMEYDNNSGYSTALNLAANGGSIACAIFVPATMRLEACQMRNTDTNTARIWGWDLYVQNGETNVLDRVAACAADESFTPSGASVRTLGVGSAPVVLSPGIYWLVIQNRHGTNGWGVGTTAASGIWAGATQTKTTTNPNGSTLDFTAATWTKTTATPGAILTGRVFGQSAAF